MTQLLEQIQQLANTAKEQYALITSSAKLEEWRIEYIGRKGQMPMHLRSLKDVPPAERATVGSTANKIRAELEDLYKEKAKQYLPEKKHSAPKNSAVSEKGHIHPLTLAREKIEAIFTEMGFEMARGPEVEEVRYAFDLLNMPEHHPARAMTDTFYVQNKEAQTVLRQHTSSVQLRSVIDEKRTPPIRIFSPGRVFRAERTDATHETTFYQVEGLVIDENATIADFKGTIEQFYSRFFGKKISSRLRPSYFPFVEPGFEVDISCVFCESKGCRICKQTGWIEVMGAGMVHPTVLTNMGIDHQKYQGFAFGGAIDRITMLTHGIDDIRLFWSGDIRFLRQFS